VLVALRLNTCGDAQRMRLASKEGAVLGIDLPVDLGEVDGLLAFALYGAQLCQQRVPA